MTKIPFDKRMAWLVAQFQNYAFSDASYKPEYEAAKQISEIVSGKKKLSKEDIEGVVTAFNATNDVPHNGGTGWKDLRLHVGTLIRNQKMAYKLTSEGNIEIQEPELEE